MHSMTIRNAQKIKRAQHKEVEYRNRSIANME